MAAVAMVAMTFFVYQYVNLNVRLLELRQLRHEAGGRSQLVERVGQFEGDLNRMRDLDRRLRVLVGLDKAESQPPALAQGGAGLLGVIRGFVQNQYPEDFAGWFGLCHGCSLCRASVLGYGDFTALFSMAAAAL